MTEDRWNTEDLDEVKWDAFSASSMLITATEHLIEMRVIEGLRHSYTFRCEDWNKIREWYTVMQKKARSRLFQLGWKPEEE